MFGEQRIYSHLGVRKENSRTYIVPVISMKLITSLYAKSSGLKVEGVLPAEGSGLIVANHIDIQDACRVCFAGLTAAQDVDGSQAMGRLVRGVGKSPLFGIPESPSVKEKTGKSDLLNSDNSLVNALTKMTLGNFLYGIGGIPLKRGMVDREAIEAIEQALISGQLVGISLMESRVKTGELRGIKPGAALLIRQNPEVPVYLAGISKKPHRIKIAPPFTFAELKRDKGNLSARELTMEMADRIAQMLPPRIQQTWLKERDLEQLKLAKVKQ